MFRKRPPAALPPRPDGGLWVIREVEASCGSRVFSGGRVAFSAHESQASGRSGRDPGAARLEVEDDCRSRSCSETLAAAQGTALSGRRTAAVLHGNLESALPALRQAARRHVPLVVHVLGESDHVAYHLAAESGCVLVMPEDAQQSTDLTLVAHSLSEQSLVPVVLLHDWLRLDGSEQRDGLSDPTTSAQTPPEAAPTPESSTATSVAGDQAQDRPHEWTAPLDLPSPRLVRRYLGQEDDDIESPSEAQFQIFGEFRRRVPRWIDPDHPVAWPDEAVAWPDEAVAWPDEAVAGPDDPTAGTSHSAPWPDRSPFSSARSRSSAAQVGREIFFRHHVADLARKAADRLTQETGRPLTPIRTYEIEKAEQVIVAQGAAFHSACRVARRLRKDGQSKVGVLGLTWLRPLAASELRELLSSSTKLTFVERIPPVFSAESPLRGELTSALGRWDNSWITAHLPIVDQKRADARLITSNIIEKQLITLLEEQRNRPGGRSRVVLGLPAGPGESPFPKRESLLAAVRNAYPQLKSLAVDGESAAAQPGDGRDASRLTAAPGESPAGGEPHIPPLVRRMGSGERGFQDLATFWGDVAQPLREGGYEGLPDPLATLGSVPSSSAALAPPVKGDILPVIDPDKCSGCGHCWTLCPDSAISATVLGLRAWLDQAIKPLAKHPEGGSLRRVMGKWTAQIASRLRDGQALDADLVVQSYRDVAPDPPAKPTAATAQAGGEEPRAEGRPEVTSAGETGAQGSANQGTGKAPSNSKLFSAGPAAAHPGSKQHTDQDTRTSAENASSLLGALRAALEDATASPAVLTERFFEQPESRKQGHGALLFLGFNPATCRACRACVEECPEDALAAAPRHEVMGQASRAWNALENLPDTPGRIIAEALGQAETSDTAQATSLLGQSPHSSDPQAQNPVLKHGFASRTNAAGVGQTAQAAAPKGDHEPLRSVTGTARGGAKRDAGSGQDETGIDAPPKAVLAGGPSGGVDEAGGSPQRVDGNDHGQATESPRPYPGWTRLASMMLSRHCAQAQLGGGFSQPGSGARLAGRLVAAVAEYAGQQQSARRIRRLQELTGQVHDRLHKLLSAGLDEADPLLLESALGELGESETRLSRLDDALAKRGRSIRLDRDKIADLAHLERLLQDASWRLEEGPSRLGRARFQVVTAGPSAAGWAARYPWHPFHAPLVADLSEQGIDLTLGLAESSAREAVQEARLLRSAQLKAQDPPDLKDQLRQLDHLTWKDLDEEERAACTPVLLYTEPQTLAAHSLASLSRLMNAPYPIKVVLFNRHEEDFGTLFGGGPEGGEVVSRKRTANAEHASSALLVQAMFFSKTFLLSSTPAHPAHLCGGLEKALEYAGPALIDLYAPSPIGDGFAPSDYLLRAGGAVQARVHPLLMRDPRSDGVLGTKISLQGNPAPAQEWGEMMFSDWARGEVRLDSLDADRLDALSELCQQRWKSLQELAGVASPFVDRIRQQLEKETDQQLKRSQQSLESQYEERRAHDEQGFQQQVAQALRRRLRQLAGLDRH